jgi:hypothetical protein
MSHNNDKKECYISTGSGKFITGGWEYGNSLTGNKKIINLSP